MWEFKTLFHLFFIHILNFFRVQWRFCVIHCVKLLKMLVPGFERLSMLRLSITLSTLHVYWRNVVAHFCYLWWSTFISTFSYWDCLVHDIESRIKVATAFFNFLLKIEYFKDWSASATTWDENRNVYMKYFLFCLEENQCQRKETLILCISIYGILNNILEVVSCI